MNKSLPPYFEEMLDNKMETLNKSLETLKELARDNQKSIASLTDSIKGAQFVIKWVIVWVSILTLSHIFAILGKPLPIDRLISIL